MTTKCKNSGAVIVAWNGITNYSTSVTPLSHCLPHAHIVLLPHHECTPPTSRTSHRTRTTPDLFAPGPHGAYDVEPNVTATFLNVPPTCANSPIDVPCASAHATSYRPPLFYCQFSTQSGYKSDAVVTSGPFHAFAYSETVAGVLVGVGVGLQCPKPALTDLGQASGEDILIDLDILHGPSQHVMKYDGVPQGNQLFIPAVVSPSMPPPAVPSPSPPPPSPPSPPPTASCAQMKASATAAGKSFTAGKYTFVLPSGSSITTECDSNGWMLVIKFTGTASLEQSGAVGGMPSTYSGGLAKVRVPMCYLCAITTPPLPPCTPPRNHPLACLNACPSACLFPTQPTPPSPIQSNPDQRR